MRADPHRAAPCRRPPRHDSAAAHRPATAARLHSTATTLTRRRLNDDRNRHHAGLARRIADLVDQPRSQRIQALAAKKQKALDAEKSRLAQVERDRKMMQEAAAQKAVRDKIYSALRPMWQMLSEGNVSHTPAHAISPGLHGKPRGG